MIGWAIAFLIIALVAALLGFGVFDSRPESPYKDPLGSIFKIIFVVFLIAFVLALIF